MGTTDIATITGMFTATRTGHTWIVAGTAIMNIASSTNPADTMIITIIMGMAVTDIRIVTGKGPLDPS